MPSCQAKRQEDLCFRLKRTPLENPDFTRYELVDKLDVRASGLECCLKALM